MYRSIPDLGSSDPVYGIERYNLRDRAIPSMKIPETFHEDARNFLQGRPILFMNLACRTRT